MVRLTAALVLCATAASLPKSLIEERLKTAPVKNSQREPELAALFRQAGCDAANLIEQPIAGVKSPNVICTLPGQLDSTIVVGAHFDFVAKGQGVIDNWTGAALLPSLLESFRRQPRHHTFLFIGFAAEEEGLLGSRYFVEQLHPYQLQLIRAMINMDSLGTSPTKVETERADQELLNALSLVADNLHLHFAVANVHDLGLSDSDTFQDRRIPTLNFHSVTLESFKLLHNRRDKMSAVNMDDYYDSFQLLDGFLAYLDTHLQ